MGEDNRSDRKVSLTLEERDRLAQWMGWELRPVGGDWEAWHDGTQFVMLPEHWRPDIDCRDAEMLLERLGEQYECGVYRTMKEMEPTRIWRAWVQISDDRCVTDEAGTLPEAIAHAVLMMLEVQEAQDEPS